jgi:hypothetical protein
LTAGVTHRTKIASLALAAVVAASAVPGAAGVSAKAHRSLPTRLCPLITKAQRSAAHITVLCVGSPPKTFGDGPIQTRVVAAAFGNDANGASWLSVKVQKILGDPLLVSQAQAAFRKSVLTGGERVKIGDVASVATHTYGGARHKGRLLMVADGYDVVIELNDDNPVASKATIKAVLVSIGKSVAAKA